MASSAKRKAFTNIPTRPSVKKRKSNGRPIYAKQPTAEELELYPPGYTEGEWPAEKILEEDDDWYLIQWAPDPFSLLPFRPERVLKRDVGVDLVKAWKEKKARRHITLSPRSSSSGSLRSSSRKGSEHRTGSRTRSSRRRPIVLDSSSPAPEIQETQQPENSTTESIKVQISPAESIVKEDYQILSRSSASVALQPSRENFTLSARDSTKDQEEDSALGLSSPTHETPAQDTSSFIGQDSHSLDHSASYVPTTSASSTELPPIEATRPITEDLQVLRSDPIVETFEPPTSTIQATQITDPTETAASSPLFFPGTQREASPGAIAASKRSSLHDHDIASSAQLPLLIGDDSQSGSALLVPIVSREGLAFTIPQTSSSVTRPSDSLIVEGRPELDSQVPLAVGSISQRTEENSQVFARTLSPNSVVASPSPKSSNLAVDRSSLWQHTRGKKLFQSIVPSRPERQASPRTSGQHSQSVESSPALSLPADMTDSLTASSSRLRRPPVASPDRGTSDSSFRERLKQSRAPARALQEARRRNAVPISASAQESPSSPRGSIGHVTTSQTAMPEPSGPAQPGATASSSNTAESADQEPALGPTLAPAPNNYNAALGSSALPSQSAAKPGPPPLRLRGIDMPRTPILGRAEYVIGLPIEGRSKRIYLDWLKEEPMLYAFLRKSRPEAVEMERMTQLINHLDDTTTHTDLTIEGPTTQPVEPTKQQADWADATSSKFTFLGSLIGVLLHHVCCLVILAKEGPIMDILENYVKARKVKYCRSSRFQSGAEIALGGTRTAFVILLISSNASVLPHAPHKPTMMVAFDKSVKAQAKIISRIRAHTCFHHFPAPVVFPVVTNSAEHIDRCLPTDLPSSERLRFLVKATCYLSSNLGGAISHPPGTNRLDHRAMHTAMLAEKKSLHARIPFLARYVADTFIADTTGNPWQLPKIEDLNLDDMDDGPLEADRDATPRSRTGTPVSQKRLPDGEAVTAASKRPRLTPLPDVMHISDSISEPQSQIRTLQQALQTAQLELSDAKKSQTLLEQNLATVQQQLDDTLSDRGNLIKRYEERMRHVHLLRKSVKKLEGDNESFVKLQERSALDNTALKEQGALLQAELTTAREDLKKHGGGLCELELAREEVRRLTARNVFLEKSNASKQQDCDFFTQQYQAASGKAAEYASQVSDFESEIGKLKQKASDERRRLSETNHKEDVRKHLAKVAQLEQMVKNQNMMLQRKEEELSAMRKGRGVVTRGSSVQPGSPRPTGSRGGSPAPGMLLSGTYAGSRASALRHEGWAL